MSDEDRDDPDRDAILRRRNRLVAIALSGVAAASLGACAQPTPCLDPVAPDSGVDASSMPCLSVDGGIGRDAGSDAGPGESDAGDVGADAGDPDAGADGGPLPCLAPPP